MRRLLAVSLAWSTPSRYYQTIGVPRSATIDEVKAAYRSQIASVHPDRDASPEAREKFLSITEAYREIVQDTEPSVSVDGIVEGVSWVSELAADVGRLVVLPLARDVMAPLLNATVQTATHHLARSPVAQGFFSDERVGSSLKELSRGASWAESVLRDLFRGEQITEHRRMVPCLPQRVPDSSVPDSGGLLLRRRIKNALQRIRQIRFRIPVPRLLARLLRWPRLGNRAPDAG